jgi:hypothetical protein
MKKEIFWDEVGKTGDVALPPWFVIKLSHGSWSTKGWFWWSAYCGPPVVFLTRKNADKQARKLYQQYKPCAIEIIRLLPERTIKTFGKKSQ